MKIEDQICSLELAKQLKKLGVQQDSLFYRFPSNNHEYIFCKYYEQYSPHINLNIEDGYSAFTVSELLEMLPCSINQWGLQINATSCVANEGIKSLWHVTYADYDKEMIDSCCDINLSNAIAELLIYLLEKNILNVNECDYIKRN